MELFEQVSFDLTRRTGPNGEEQTGLLIHLSGKSWGPHYLRTGVTLQAASNGDNTYGLRFGLLSTGLSHWGAEWRNDVLLGTEHFLVSEWYQPLDPEGVWFVAPRAEERRYPRGVYSGDQQTAKYQVRLERIALDLGTTFGDNAWEGRAGIVKEWVQQSRQVGPVGLNPTSIQQVALTVGIKRDTLDAPAFPREGQQGHVTLTTVPRQFGAQAPYHKVSAALGQVFSWHEFTVYGLAQGESSLNSQTPIYDLATQGGLFHLSGYPQGGLSGQHAVLGSLVAYQRLARFPTGLGSGAFAGGSLETGSAWNGALKTNLNTWVAAGSLFVGTNTAAGPLTLALAYAGRSRWAGYLVIGQVF
ncbi:MAG: hypothetical protein COX57_03670 [Alphaproteobacteria bacterium CG_4_10_14_0_2_um_filter_63_37]|nr:MAG: hypothetical protein AUJ55_05965 [Proteobacteria bacterium CG1_02_64_396]PJA25358.1 MAG: hypothetical protein COX57_03670 [Alphaproteobacteria bacterium CG_4_10_14_0_2_um_filter_63_37]